MKELILSSKFVKAVKMFQKYVLDVVFILFVRAFYKFKTYWISAANICVKIARYLFYLKAIFAEYTFFAM